MNVIVNIYYAADESAGGATAEAAAQAVLEALGGDPATDTCTVNAYASASHGATPTAPGVPMAAPAPAPTLTEPPAT